MSKNQINIPDQELNFSFARSSGPGGQNVNKTNSKVVLTWNVYDAATIPDPVKQRFSASYGNRISESGDVVILSDETRDRLQNQNRCVEKLIEMLQAVWDPPKERKPTKPTKSSRRKRLASKRQRSETKSARGKIREW